MRKYLLLLIVMLSVLVLANYLYNNRFSWVSSFEDCASAKLPIREMYPPVCVTPDGRTFTQNIEMPLTVQTEPEDVAISTTFKLNFEKGSVTLDTLDLGNAVYTFWTRSINNYDGVNAEIDDSTFVTALYADNTYDSLNYVGGVKDTYYELFPGFYRKLYITDSAGFFKSMANSTKCVSSEGNLSFRKVVKQTCTNTVMNPVTKANIESVISNCYLPLDDTNYLAYVQVGNIVEGRYDLCAELTKMGVQSWFFAK